MSSSFPLPVAGRESMRWLNHELNGAQMLGIAPHDITSWRQSPAPLRRHPFGGCPIYPATENALLPWLQNPIEPSRNTRVTL